MKRKKRSGVSAALALFIFTFLPAHSHAAKKKAVPEAYALISGTVFQEAGYALPEAEITLIPDPNADNTSGKLKKMQSISDARGEFVFRVPQAYMQYIVKVKAKGYQVQEKSATVQGDERVDVTFQLQPESK